MSVRTLKIPYPKELLETLEETPEAFERKLRFLVAAKLYELGHISSGRAAELAGMERVEFLNQLGQYRIPVFNYPLEELEREIQQAQERARYRGRCHPALELADQDGRASPERGLPLYRDGA